MRCVHDAAQRHAARAGRGLAALAPPLLQAYRSYFQPPELALHSMLRLLLLLCVQQRAQAAALPPPLLDLPAEATGTILPNPHFSWHPVCDPVAIIAPLSACGCGGYRIQISRAGGGGVMVDATVASVLTRFVPVTPLAVGHYFWRVAPLDADGTLPAAQPWSPSRTLFIVPPTREIHVPATATYSDMQAAFAEAAASPVPTAVRFAPNIVATLDPVYNGEIFASLANCSDIILDFNGASLTFTKFVGFFNFDTCERVCIRDLTVDLQPLPYSALRIDSVAADYKSFRGSVMPGHPPPEVLNITTRNGGEVMNPITTRTKRGVIEGVTFIPEFARGANGSYTVALNNAKGKNGTNPGLNVGDAFIVGERTGPGGFMVLGGSEVTVLGVTVHACANECFTSAYTTKLSILSTSMVLLPGRFKAGNDGGHNHHSSRIGAWIEGGHWQNTGDDICHVSSLVISATQQWTAPTTGAPMLRLAHSSGDPYMRDHGGGRLTQIHVGDTLQFFNRTSGVLLSERTVRNISFDTGPADPETASGVTVVELDASPGALDLGVIGDITAATNVFDLNATATQLVFRNNSVLNGRRFGVLAKGLRLVIEDNTFVGLGSGAVQYLNSITEGLCARSAVVRRNVVEDVMQLASHGAPPLFDPNGAFWASTMPRQQPVDPEAPPMVGPGVGIPCHQDLLYSNNTVSSGPHSVVQLYAASGVRVEGNTVTRCRSTNPQFDPWSFQGADSEYAVEDNAVTNVTSARLCTKHAALVKTAGDSSVYFVDYLYWTGGGISAAPVLHKLGSCHRCGDPQLCERMGVNTVESDFITARRVGPAFDCVMLPGPRVLKCSACAAADHVQQQLVFEPQPGEPTVHAISSCEGCGGELCSVVVDVDPEYWARLSVAAAPFACGMASGASA